MAKQGCHRHYRGPGNPGGSLADRFGRGNSRPPLITGHGDDRRQITGWQRRLLYRDSKGARRGGNRLQLNRLVFVESPVDVSPVLRPARPSSQRPTIKYCASLGMGVLSGRCEHRSAQRNRRYQARTHSEWQSSFWLRFPLRPVGRREFCWRRPLKAQVCTG